jgi:hypothetical protein
VIKTYFISKPKKRSTTISPKASSGDLEKEGKSDADNVVIELGIPFRQQYSIIK